MSIKFVAVLLVQILVYLFLYRQVFISHYTLYMALLIELLIHIY